MTKLEDYTQDDWKKLDGTQWRIVLGSRPQFAEHCRWESISGNNWRILLTRQPHLAERCDWSKLSGEDWRWLLIANPIFAEQCKWEKLNEDDWGQLWENQYHLRDFINKHSDNYLMMREVSND